MADLLLTWQDTLSSLREIWSIRVQCQNQSIADSPVGLAGAYHTFITDVSATMAGLVGTTTSVRQVSGMLSEKSSLGRASGAFQAVASQFATVTPH